MAQDRHVGLDGPDGYATKRMRAGYWSERCMATALWLHKMSHKASGIYACLFRGYLSLGDLELY